MTSNDAEILLYRILSGKTYLIFEDQEYVLVAPDIDTRYRAALLYDNIINEEKYQEWIREENMELAMIALEVWGPNTSKVVKGLEKTLDTLKIALYKQWTDRIDLKKTRAKLTHTRQELNKLYRTKQEFFNHTLEGYALSAKHEYIICNVLTKAGRKVFNTQENTSQDNRSFIYFNSLVSEIEKSVITAEQVRALARHSVWNSYWSVHKQQKIFAQEIAEWTDEQKLLISMSGMYSNIREHPECPPDLVIEDDDMLDGWMLIQQDKQERSKKQDAISNRASNMNNADEIFLIADNKTSREDIQDLNEPDQRQTLKNKFIEISEHKGHVQDFELQDVKQKIKNQIAALNSQ